ncbi:MAG TPA: VOC family protein [Jatrophihabitans sp.]|nr:VOC family protein [Jatrophihabitans sp.]
MRPNRSIPASTVIPVLSYPDVRGAVAWLVAAFGFVERVRIGEGHRAQLSVGDGAVIVADTGGNRRAPDPAVITHSVTVRVSDLQAQFGRAMAQGATIVMEPTEFPFGERQCTVQDPWGHRWTFSHTIADVAPEEWGGQTIAPA